MTEASLPAAQTDESATASAPRNGRRAPQLRRCRGLTKPSAASILDADLVSAVEGTTEGDLSAVLDEALRCHVERQREHAALGAWLDEMERAEGVPDPAEVAYFTRLLGGAAS